MRKERLCFAIVGSRGIPANYGGFETFAQELGLRLVRRGHSVVVTCRRTSYPKDSSSEYLGIVRRTVWAPHHKYLETPFSSLLALTNVTLRDRPDLVILVNGINAFASWIPRIRGIPVALCVDGIERQRAKWSAIGRFAYLANERLACHFPNAIVSDADVIAEYYLGRYGKRSRVIRYGATPGRTSDVGYLENLGLRLDEYVLYVSRLEPENNAALVIDAFSGVKTGFALAIVGDAPYATEYKLRLHTLAEKDDRVKMLGGVYGDGYRSLQGGAKVYVQATNVGGTHPALIEAMAAGNAVCAMDTPENHEVLGDSGLYFRTAPELASLLTQLLEDESARAHYGRRAYDRALALFDWDAVADMYVALASELRGN